MFEKLLKLVSVFFLAAVLGFGSYAAYLHFYGQGEDHFLYDYLEDGISFLRIPEPAERKKVSSEPFSVLLMGIDTEDVNEGRADTLAVAIVDPTAGNVTTLSIPRDTKMAIGTHFDKVNHSFAEGGAALTRTTVENFLGIPIDYHVAIDFQGFQDLVEAFGGIDIDVETDIRFPDRITKTNFTIDKGPQTLNGIQALNYARYRGGPDGDFGRNARQQQVIHALLGESKDWKNITKIKKVYDAISDNVETDLTLREIAKITVSLHDLEREHMHSLKMDAYPFNESGVSYVGVNDEEVQRIRGELQQLLSDNKHVPRIGE